jgi:hypothetical protein
VAGKTFRGVGEDEAPSVHIDEDDSRPRLIDEDDARGLHSGPTVVDDQKVAEVLKKLRSLDRPPGPLTGVTEVVVDANSSEPTRLDSQPIQIDTGPAVTLGGAAVTGAGSGLASLEDVMYPLKRATEIGRSLSTPAAGQPVTVPPDAVRGTLFGRSIHLPDVNAPDAADIELSSGAVQFLDGAPGALQPFPLAERPAVVVPPPTALPSARFHTPFDVNGHTQVVDPPRSKAFKRLLAFVGGLSIAGAGVWAWWQYGGGHAASGNPPAVAAPVAAPPSAAPPSIDPMPPSAPTAPATPAPAAPPAATPPVAAPAAAAPAPDPAAAPAARPATAPEAAVPAPAAPADEPRPPSPTRPPAHARTRHAAPTKARHAAAKPTPPPDDAEPAETNKPVHSPKHPAAIDDPDATMGPSE